MAEILGHKCYPVPTAPMAFDIVWCNFPYHEEPYKPGPKKHPALVLTTKVFTDSQTGFDYASVKVAYGTSKSQKQKSPLDILHIHNYNALQHAGLCRETWFALDRTQSILWCKEYFPIVTAQSSPILGKLNHDQKIKLMTIKEMRDALKGRKDI